MIADTSNYMPTTCTIGGTQYRITGFAFEGCHPVLQDGPTMTLTTKRNALREAADAHIARNIEALIALVEV